MKNILLVVPRQKDTDTIERNYLFPLGLGYISSVLKQKGHDVDCLNLNHHEGTAEELVENELDKKYYDVVCTGSMTMGFHEVKRIVDTVKNYVLDYPRIWTIVGGILVTSEPEVVFDLLNPDFAVVGEGEETICELLDCIDKQKDYSNIKGLLFRDEQKHIVFTGRRNGVQDLDSLPYPDFEGLGFEEYLDNLYCNCSPLAAHNSFDHPRVYPILGSRGCPFSCTFCYHYDRYRKRSVENIRQELQRMVKKYRINRILFFDECLAIDKNRLYAICDIIKEIQAEVSWELKWQPQLTVRDIDQEMLRMLHESNVDVISYGFESMSPTVLKSMNKPITPEMISTVFHTTINEGMGTIAAFIFGDVAETTETAGVTLDWWKQNCRGQIDLSFIQPYPGSRIYEHCIEKGIIPDRSDFIQNQMRVKHWYNMTDGMTDDEINKLKNDVIVLNFKYCQHTYPLSMKRMKKNVYDVRVRCPLCKSIVEYKNLFIENRRTFSVQLFCRSCHLNFYVVSFIRRIVYRFVPGFMFPKLLGFRIWQSKFVHA